MLKISIKFQKSQKKLKISISEFFEIFKFLDNFIYRSLDESHENIFYIDQKSRFSFIEKKTFEKYSHESKSVSGKITPKLPINDQNRAKSFKIDSNPPLYTLTDSIESIVDLVQLDRAFKYMFAVTTSNSTKKVIYSMNLKTENVQTYKIKGNQVLDATSDYNGDFFYIGVEYTKLYEIPAIHVFKLGDVLIERTLILEIPDFGFISAIHAYYNLLLVFVSERVLVMRRDDPRRFVLESTHGLPFSKDSEGKMGSKRVDQVGVFGRYHVGVIRFGYGFVLKKVTDYISKEEGGRGRHILDRSESFEQGVGGGSFDMMSGVGGD